MDYKKIYESSFNQTGYNLHPDNEFRFQFVNDYIKTNEINSIIDIGSGRGNILKIIKETYPNVEVTSTDIKKFHNIDVPFFELNLCDTETYDFLNERKFDLLSCLDVMEHIEKKCVDDVLKFFSNISKKVLLTIANHSDVQNGIELHVIQEGMNFWGPVIEKYFFIDDVEVQYNGRLYLLKLTSKQNQNNV